MVAYGMMISRGKPETLRENPAPVTLHPPQLSPGSRGKKPPSS